MLKSAVNRVKSLMLSIGFSFLTLIPFISMALLPLAK